MKSFNLLNAPLEGTHLIEAGAGTGKTYSIASVFLRLVLERSMPVERILVLTFTRAATRELKERIRARLYEMKAALNQNEFSDDLCAHLLARAQAEGKQNEWRWLLETALANFDNANICNFHQFCQKVIKDYAVETGGLFDAEIMTDNAAVMEQAACDYFRQNVYHHKPVAAAYMAERLSPHGLQRLARETQNITAWEERSLMPPLKDVDENALEKAASDMVRIFGQMQSVWLLSQSEIMLALNSGVLHGGYYKANIIQRMRREMDGFLSGLLAYPLPANFEKWQAGFMLGKTKKNCQPPRHRFFELCEELAQTYDRFETLAQNLIHNLKIKAPDFILKEAAVQKELLNKLDFNDLIAMVGRAVLKNPAGGLKHKLQNSFDAVMVDEFQDTDALQYRLFSSLFANSAHLFFMIGDPKQAIYAFRGADVFSYFNASQNTRSAFSLTTNWRSVPSLVEAVNHVFKLNPNAPFVVDEIEFTPAVSSLAKESLFDDEPLVIWYLDSRRQELGAKPPGPRRKDYELSDANAADRVIRAVAGEIMRLLNDNAKALKPGDIAVLVNSNRQGRLVYEALHALKIPAAINGDEQIYNTEEAKELLLILASAAQPDNLQKLKAAYTTKVFGGLAGDYLDNPQNDDLWIARLQKMREHNQNFARQGFLSMFLSIMFSENSFARLLKAPNGCRRVTNFVHLAELLHEKAGELNLTLAGLERYLRRAVNGGLNTTDDTGLRLETDHDVVQVVTVHKSKGLEYEVVFYPFAWEGVGSNPGEIYKYHDKNDVNFGFDADDPAYSRYLRESLAERLRLLYVALTRAKQRCYVAYGRVKTLRKGYRGKFETAALTYLLWGQELGADLPDLVEQMQERFGNAEYDDEMLLAALNNLAHNAVNCIKIMPLPLGGMTETYAETKPPAVNLRQMGHQIAAGFKVTSFSGLTQNILSDVFEGRDLEQGEDAAEAPLGETPPEPFSIFAMPKGAHVGNFFHDLLENVDFSEAAYAAPMELILDKLKAYNLDEGYAPAVGELVQNLCNVNLAKSTGGQVSLKSASGVLKEMEFYFPLNAITQNKLGALFAQNTNWQIPAGFSAQSLKFTFSQVRGYLKGFIDLAFCHKGRFYLADWKSNYEGAEMGDYTPERLLDSVARHSYFLQYYLYTLAFCQYLRLRIPDFSYDRDFGGVFYVFLRGLAQTQIKNEDFGVFRDRPPLGLVNALGHLLVNGFTNFEE